MGTWIRASVWLAGCAGSGAHVQAEVDPRSLEGVGEGGGRGGGDGGVDFRAFVPRSWAARGWWQRRDGWPREVSWLAFNDAKQ